MKQDAHQAGPLAGIRVIELGSFIAAPSATRILAEFGADVIKIERPDGGDELRSWRLHDAGTSLLFRWIARNKRSVTIDLHTPQGQALARQLIDSADVLIENFRPGTLERWNLGPEVLRASNPGLVVVRISGFGQTGPYREHAGFGGVAEAMAGLRHLTGNPGEAPVRVGISLGDQVAGLHGVIGALMGLLQRRSGDGTGDVVDVALHEAMFSMMESLVPDFDAYGIKAQPSGPSIPGVAPSGTYRCANDKFVVIGGNGDRIFHRLMMVIERPDLRDDTGLAGNAGRVARSDELGAAIGAWTADQQVADVVGSLSAHGVPCGTIYDVEDILADPQFAAREMYARHKVDIGGQDIRDVYFPGIVPKLERHPGEIRHLGPELGADTDEVLGSLGIGVNEIAGLREQGVV
ncbi:MAG: CoA transferase [Flavobacterium sp.]|nr:CoA transferase [Aeromicrobium sp.]